MKPAINERDVEAYFVAQCKARGWGCYKFTSPGRRNVPDRIVILPGGSVAFVELKAPGKKPTAGQAREHDRLRRLECVVFVADTFDAVDTVIHALS